MQGRILPPRLTNQPLPLGKLSLFKVTQSRTDYFSGPGQPFWHRRDWAGRKKRMGSGALLGQELDLGGSKRRKCA